FIILRALFGIGMGGEWGVGASLAMEKAPAARRGIFSGFLQEGYALGNLLALYVRSHVKESEVWEKSRHTNWGDYGRNIAANWKLFLYLVFLMAMMNFVSHGTQDMYPTFLQRDWHVTPERKAIITAIGNVGAIVGGILFGHFSDRIGRRKSIVIALVLAIVMIPLWAYAPSIPLLMVGAFAMQFMVQGAWGVIPAHINELAPNSVRGFFPGFAYQCGVMIAGTVTAIEPMIARHTSYANAMAVTAVSVFTLGAIAA